MSDAARFLGFAFANADFLFEIDKTGTILFATGAAREFVREDCESLIGRPAGTLFQNADGDKFAAFARALSNGGRTGPVRLKVVGGSEANVSMFRLPHNQEKISCTLAKSGGHGSFAQTEKDDKTGLHTRDSFLSAAADLAGEDDAMTLLNLPLLPKLCRTLSPEKVDRLLASIGKAIAMAGAKLAGRISETGFSAIADAVKGPPNLAGHIRSALAADGLAETKIEETLVSLKGKSLSPEQRMLAVRYVVDRFAAGRNATDGKGDLGDAFNAMMDETHIRVRGLTDAVADGAFSLAYQPIRDLQTGALSHFEALARFKPGQTAETIQFVEALGIADAFDLAVALKVLSVIETDKTHKASVAFNVSGHTIQSAASFAMLAGFLARKRKLAPRVLIEITETAQITDLESAAKAVTALRTLGYRVGLDDFGAGAATLNYLHAFTLDFVKFDGALVKKMGQSKRDDMLVAGVLKLCDELKVTTVAECLENEEDIAKARRAGFHLGQGYAYGAPAAKIPAGSGSCDDRSAKRKGVEETWA